MITITINMGKVDRRPLPGRHLRVLLETKNMWKNKGKENKSLITSVHFTGQMLQ